MPLIIQFLGYVPYDTAISFHGKVLYWRKSLERTQREFVRVVGVDPGTIGRLEFKGKRLREYKFEQIQAFLSAYWDKSFR